MGAWDGRRGWIYHVATAPPYRRRSLATRLVSAVEAGFRDLGARRVRVVVQDGNEGAEAFWTARGFEAAPVRLFGRDL